MINETQLREIVGRTKNRFELWKEILNVAKPEEVAEVGVFRGNYAKQILESVPSIRKYTMVDPWIHMEVGYKDLANVSDEVFNEYYEESMAVTEFAKEKRVVLRGMTQEVADQVPDNSLDFIYIDGDHTLRGITVDFIKWWPKLKPGGMIGGDDFEPSIFQQPLSHEPSPIFPWSIYFAESMDVPVYGLPGQVLIVKDEDAGYSYTDLDGRYGNLSLRDQIVRGPLWYVKKQFLAPIYRSIFKRT